ncbi:MAG: DUF393 domain-containing protein [Mariniblastus sp.]|nr:DUF393 domain-containing protein [Mariniblastus sp.]
MNATDSQTETEADKTVSEAPRPIDPALPTPEDLPAADILIFDGNCSFCTGQVLKISRWSGGRIAFISLHDPEVSRRFPDLTEEMLMKEIYLVTRQGRRYGGASVLRYLSRRLPRLWVFAPLLHIPGTLGFWQWCYQKIAKRRYQISARHGHQCHDGSCEVHLNK